MNKNAPQYYNYYHYWDYSSMRSELDSLSWNAEPNQVVADGSCGRLIFKKEKTPKECKSSTDTEELGEQELLGHSRGENGIGVY